MATTLTVFKLKTLSRLPSTCVLLTIAFLYYMYMETYLTPMLVKENHIPPQITPQTDYWRYVQNLRLTRSTIYFIVLHYLAFWFIVSYVRVVFTGPGFVPADWNKAVTDEVLDDYIAEKKVNSTGLFSNLLTKKTIENFNFMDEDFKDYLRRTGRRFCTFCRVFKPDRTHHCRQTGRCVLKMDHYCNWVSNCIGFRNYKFFLVFIFYTTLILIFITGTYIMALVHVFTNPNVSDGRFFMIAFAFLLALSFCVILTAFTVFHFGYLVWGNRTTLEFCEKSHLHSYDEGPWRNWVSVFGKNPIWWFFPLFPNLDGSGLKYCVKTEGKAGSSHASEEENKILF